MTVCISVFFSPLMLVWIVGGDVCPVPITAPEEPSRIYVHHQSFAHPQLQK